jgi:multidrug efflux system outer membrane protein
MKRLLATFALSLCVMFFCAACLVGPNYNRPAVATPPAYRGIEAPDTASGGTAGVTTPLGAQKWNTVFTDPVLQGLIEEALRNNFDVRIAADRVLEQQAQVAITRAAQFPTLTAGGSLDTVGLPGSLLKKLSSDNNNNGGGSNNNKTSSNVQTGGLTASAAFNVDFWGLYRRQTEAARAQLRATEWARQLTFSTLVENVATAYYQLRTLDAELEITRETLAARQQSLDLTRKLDEGGAGTLADVRQAEQLAFTADAQIPDLERQIAQQENSLSILLGRAPGLIARGEAIADLAHPAAVPVGLPSDLLERRPDIRRAEELLVQANADIGAARAQYFPQFPLSATGGSSSDRLLSILASGNFYYYATATLSQTIFDGGKIRGNYRLALAQHKELVDTYQQTILGALRDVSNALSAYTKTREYREKQERETGAATDAVRLARMRFAAGATSFLEVLTNDANLYNSQLTLKAAQEQEALALVQLYNALGGGW